MNISDKSFQSRSATTVQWDHVAVSWLRVLASTPHICLSRGLKLAQGKCRDVCCTSLHTHLSPKPLHMMHNQTVDKDVTSQAAEELRVSQVAAGKNSRARQLCGAQMLAFMQCAVPGEEPMSVYMFSQTLLICLLLRETGARGEKGNFPLHQPPRRTNWISSTSSNGEVTTWPTGRVSPTCGLRNCAGRRPQNQREGQQCFQGLFKMPFYGLCSASQHPVVSAVAGSLNSAEVGAKLSPETAPSVPGRQNFTRILGGTLLNHKRDTWVFLCVEESQFSLFYCLPPGCC